MVSVRLVKSGKWNLPVGTHGRGARPHTEDAEEVEDLLTYCQNQLLILVQTLEVGGGEGSGGAPAINTGAAAGATGFTTGGAVGIGALATLACIGGATACVAGGAGPNRAAMGGEGKEYGGGGTPIRIGVIRGRWRKV